MAPTIPTPPDDGTKVAAYVVAVFILALGAAIGAAAYAIITEFLL